MNQVIKRGALALQQIEQKKNILSLPAVQSKLSQGEFRVAKLATGTAIKDIPDRDLRIVDNEEKDFGLVAKAGILAKGIARDFAIRNVERAEAFRFMDILKKYYSGFTLDEVRSAFELALVGELDAYLPKDKNGVPDKNHYQIFSVEFITKILNAYKSYKGKVWGKVFAIADKVEPEVTQTQKDEFREGFLKRLREMYAGFCAGEMPVIIFPRTIAEYLIEKNWVDDRELSQADFNKAVIMLKSSSTADPFSKLNILEAYKNGETDRLKAEAEQAKAHDLILSAFKRMKEENAQI
jgi:hypothetical protein